MNREKPANNSEIDVRKSKSYFGLFFPTILVLLTTSFGWLLGNRFGYWWHRGAMAGFLLLAPLSFLTELIRFLGWVDSAKANVLGFFLATFVRTMAILFGGLLIFVVVAEPNMRPVDVLGYWGILIAAHLASLIGDVSMRRIQAK